MNFFKPVLSRTAREALKQIDWEAIPMTRLFASLHDSVEEPLHQREPAYVTARTLRIVAGWLADPATANHTRAELESILREAAEDFDPEEEL